MEIETQKTKHVIVNEQSENLVKTSQNPKHFITPFLEMPKLPTNIKYFNENKN